MRNPTLNELNHLTTEGSEILKASLQYSWNKNSYELRKHSSGLPEGLSEPIKPEKILVGNGEIIETLKLQYGIRIKSVAELNGILEKMGILEKVYKTWYQTEKGKQYSIFSIRIKPANIWTDDLIPMIADYIKEHQKHK